MKRKVYLILRKKNDGEIIQDLKFLQILENFTHPTDDPSKMKTSVPGPAQCFSFLFPGNGSIILDTVAD